MDSLMADGVISLDDRPAQEAIKRTNTALDDHEKKVKTVLDRQGREWQVYGDTVVRVSGNSKNALDRLISSMERQAALAGKSGVDRLIAQRDQLIARWSKEQAAVDAINKSYAKLIETENAAQGAGSGFNARYAFFGLKDIAEGRTKFAVAELGNELVRMQGTALGIGLVATAIVGIGVAAYEVTKKIEELREAHEKLHGQLERMADATRLENAELELSNTKLENTIAKLEHKPGNGLKEAIEEAAVAAGKLAEKLDTSIAKYYEVMKANQITGLSSIFAPSDKDIAEMLGGKTGFGGMRGAVEEALRSGGDINKVLPAFRDQFQEMLRRAEFTKARQEGGQFEGQSAWSPYNTPTGLPTGIRMSDIEVGDYSARIEKLKEILGFIDSITKTVSLEGQHENLQRTVGVLQQQAEEERLGSADSRARREFMRGLDRYQREQYQKRMEESTRTAEGYGKGIETSLTEQFKAEKFGLQGIPIHLAAPASPYMTIEQQKAQMEAAARMGQISARTPEEAAQRQLQSRLNIIATIRDREIAALNDEAKISDLRNKADLEASEARYQYEEKIAELQKRQHDEIAKTAGGLWNTLFTKPGQFGRQLGSTVHGAILHPITEGLGNMTANLIQPMVGGISGMLRGIFGGQQDPATLATNQNTQATEANTKMLGWLPGAISAAIRGTATAAMGIPLLGTGFSLPAAAMPALSVPGISMPAPAAAASLPVPWNGGDDGSVGVPATGGHATGANPFASIFGRGGSANTGWAGMLKSFKGIDLGGLTHSPGRYSLDQTSDTLYTIQPGHINGVNGLAGAALFTGGTMLAQQGLLGSQRGTWGGVAEGTAGGAMIGMKMGGPLGAAIGAVAGFGIGIGEKIAGVETPENEATRLIKQTYAVDIPSNSGTIKQIVAMSKQYGGSVSMTIRTPEVRKLIELYAQSSGQKTNLFLQDPVAAHLQQQNNTLYQALAYNNGTGYTFGSQAGLPTLGSGSTIPTSNPYAGGPSSIVLNVNGQSAADLLEGRVAGVVTPGYVQEQASDAIQSNNGRLGMAAGLFSPNVIPA